MLAARPKGLPSESRQIAQRSPGAQLSRCETDLTSRLAKAKSRPTATAIAKIRNWPRIAKEP
jgi:hypothetical protein